MNWKGKELKTYPEIIDFALKLKEPEQGEFVEAYAKSGPHALGNVGYFSGYYDAKTAEKIMSVFKTAHPIFGTRRPDATEAFEQGKKLGEAAKRRRSS
jgi:hypothetical protein